MIATIRRTSARLNPAAEALEAVPAPRLISVDALRGFDMFWIIGAGAVPVRDGKLHS